jgi:imidazolonepropionase-like amidohydrolase
LLFLLPFLCCTPGTETIDLRYAGLPGMIDSHTHITYYWAGTTPLRQPRRHVAVAVYLARENARKTRAAGVTTVRDLGASGGADMAMRELIEGARCQAPGCSRRYGLGSYAKRPGVTDPVAEAVTQTKSGDRERRRLCAG